MKKDFNENLKKEHYENADNNSKLIINLRNINHTMHSLYEGRGSQKRILIILLENENITQQELTEKLGIKPGSASEVIAKLEKSNLIERTKNILDRRTANITLTDEGRAMAEDAKKQRETRHEEMFSALSEEDKAVLLSLLEKINSDWGKFEAEEREHHHHMGHPHHKGHQHGAHHPNEKHHKHKNNHNNDSDYKKGCDGNCSDCPHPCGRKKQK
ncbi:MAG: MarR family transcriptional regulator [Eubacterium sp.]|nr:MarR family transcriptional regulator [Eubacterium sp.]